jgi:hypothetical protein
MAESPSRNLRAPRAVFGEYDVVVLGGCVPSGYRVIALDFSCGARPVASHADWFERYGFLGGHGDGGRLTVIHFPDGLQANVHGEIRQVVHGIADDLLARMEALGGLNAPHVIFGGKIAAQAYDNAAFKIAADEVVLGSGARILFHAYAAGVAMKSPSQVDALLLETKSGALARARAESSSTAPAMPTSPRSAGVPSRNRRSCSIRPRCSA